MKKITRELPAVGQYSLSAMRMHDEYHDVANILCISEAFPLAMDVNFPDVPAEEADEAEAHEETHYKLWWPSGLIRDEVLYAMAGIGQGLANGGYRWLPPGHDSVFTAEYPRAFHKREMEWGDATDSSAALHRARQTDFGQIYFVSPKLLMAWNAEDSLYPERGGFGLRTGDNVPLTDPYVGDIVRRTIAVEHVGSVAVALENLSAIFEQYRERDPATFIN